MFNPTWLLLLAPLLSALVIFVFFRKQNGIAIACSIAACATAFVVAFSLWMGWLAEPGRMVWIEIPSLSDSTRPLLEISIGMYLNSLAKGMLLVVTGVGLMVHIFAIGYMAHDPHKARFFGELSLFMFAMLGIVVADNLVMMYIFWELVGLASYLLIGFWFHRPSADLAARKAFLCNRLGDFGFLLGILLFWSVTGTVYLTPAEFGPAVEKIGTLLPLWSTATVSVTVIGLLLFCGCVGKSAQFPLHVWLPGSMEGPTPVSALLHAATMVAAGVYMLVRIFPILELSHYTLYVIGSIGAFMTLFAAVIGTQQADIKRILAYSTLSQLGYMVLAIGCAAPGNAMFHLSTHACFKSLLFLGAGSVIVANHENQDIWKMGGLWKRMPVTFATFLIASCALAGLPFFAGFFSKDPIIDLSGELHGGLNTTWWYWFSLIAAVFTAYYIFRGVTVAFLGQPRSDIARNAKESPLVMTLPLCILALFAWTGGYPGSWGAWGWEDYYIAATDQASYAGKYWEHIPEVANNPSAYLIAFIVFACGAVPAYLIYTIWGKKEEPLQRDFITIALRDKLYFDEIYDWTILLVQKIFARILDWLDKWIIGGLIVRGAATVCTIGGEVLRLFQTGSLQAYTFIFGLGAAVLVYFLLF